MVESLDVKMEHLWVVRMDNYSVATMVECLVNMLEASMEKQKVESKGKYLDELREHY
jgi:hypothetical protein